MAHEAVDRHAEGELADAVAIRFLRLDGGADLRETFELVERLGKRAGFRIEDDDADQLRTVDSATSFLARRSAGARH
jgi:acyl carrier protein